MNPTHPNPTRRARQHQRGASMVELLVSLLIFALGTLGMVGLMSKTIGYSQVSLFRSQATALTDDILDRMRADPANARARLWDNDYDDLASSFTGTTIAEKDLADWKTQVETLLPTGRAQIAVNSGVVTVTIRWDERGTTTPMETVSSL